MPEAVLAIDQGTTGSTALVFSKKGDIIGRAYSELQQHYPQPGWVEHDADEIFEVSLKVMRQALEQASVGAPDLRAIGITNQRETTVLWDKQTGEPLHRAIVWQSRQSAGICDQLKADGHEPTFRKKTGLVVDAYFSGTKIKWILDAYPEARAKAEKGHLLFGTIDTWLLWKLTGGATHATDPTNASRTLLYNIHEQKWDSELTSILTVPEPMLPEVLPSSSELGVTASNLPIPAGVPVAGIAGDQQAALYGQGCWEPGMAKNTYGTGCFAMMNMGQKESPISKGGLLTTICCDSLGSPSYALEGSIFIAGAAVQWLRDELGLIQQASETEQIAQSVEDTAGVYVVPAFAGLGAPYWDMDARGAILGLTRGANRAHVVRATVEALAYQTRDVMEVMKTDSGVEIKELRVDGGAAANDFLMQFQADILGIPVDRPTVVETTAAGSAFLAGLAVGFWQDPEELQGARKRQKLFEPQMDEEHREALYSGWKQAVRKVLKEER